MVSVQIIISLNYQQGPLGGLELQSEVENNNRLWCRYKIIISLNYQQGPRAVVSNFRSDCVGLNVT